jgi:hypothetical protein
MGSEESGRPLETKVGPEIGTIGPTEVVLVLFTWISLELFGAVRLELLAAGVELELATGSVSVTDREAL